MPKITREDVRVPADVMPETEQSNSTGQFLGIVNERLRKGGYEIRQIYEKAKTTMMSGIVNSSANRIAASGSMIGVFLPSSDLT